MMKWLISLFSTNKEKQLLPSDLHYACGEEGSIETLAKLLESKPDLEKKMLREKLPSSGQLKTEDWTASNFFYNPEQIQMLRMKTE